MKLIHWIFGAFRSRRQARAARYGVEVLCAGWVDLPAGFRASARGRALAGARGRANPALPA